MIVSCHVQREHRNRTELKPLTYSDSHPFLERLGSGCAARFAIRLLVPSRSFFQSLSLYKGRASNAAENRGSCWVLLAANKNVNLLPLRCKSPIFQPPPPFVRLLVDVLGLYHIFNRFFKFVFNLFVGRGEVSAPADFTRP